MKAKIFAKLKQEFSSLGLGDDYLMSKAESLAATGLVTDDNIDAVVACQRKELEGLQSVNDKRVADALDKQRKKHDEETQKKMSELEEAHKKALEEAKGKPTPPPTPPTNNVPTNDSRYDELKTQLDTIIADSKKRDEANAATIKTLTDSRDSLHKQVKELMDKNAAAEAEAKRTARAAMITAKAKELGVPDWRIEEGFVIAEDATDETITETLTKVANNIKTQNLPGNRGAFPLSDGKPSKEEIDAMAANLVK